MRFFAMLPGIFSFTRVCLLGFGLLAPVLPALAQTPTPAAIASPSVAPTPSLPGDVDFEIKWIKSPQGTDQIQWKLVNFHPEREPDPKVFEGMVDHGLFDVEVLPAGTAFHTWATAEKIGRWVKTHGPDEGEVKFLLRLGSGAEGGGFYTSLDPVDSAGFGAKAIIFHSTVPIKVLTDVSGFSKPQQFSLRNSEFANLLNLFNGRLLDAGISGFRYGGFTNGMTWIDLYTALPLQGGHEGSITEILQDLKGIPDLGNLLDVEQRLGLEPMPLLLEKVPGAWHLLSGISLTDEEWNAWFPPLDPKTGWEQGFANFINLSNRLPTVVNGGGEKPSFLVQQFLKLEKDKIRELVRKGMGVNDPAFHSLVQPTQNGQSRYPFRSNLIRRISYFGMKDMLAESQPFQFPRSDYLSVPSRGYIHFPDLSDLDFSQKLEWTLDFIDLPDLLVAVSNGDTAPWTRYDEWGTRPFIERLNEVSELPFNGGTEPDFLKLLLRIHEILSLDSSGFRDHGILAGGDLYPDEKGGFYRVTELEKNRILDNPFLEVEIKEDPASSSIAPTWLARHQYPSVERYAKWKEFISPALFTQLTDAEAKGELKNQSLPEYKTWNRAMLEDLVRWAWRTNFNAGVGYYQLLISIHPFSDYNGRCLRTYYRKIQWQNFFLTDWNQDLFLSPAEMTYAMEVGSRKASLLLNAIEEEKKRNPDFPKYYDLPQWFMIAEDLETVPQNTAEWVEKQKAFYRDPVNMELIRSKQFSDVFEKCRKWLH